MATPAGLGKTTLAHVVARHCGYRPLEINASDDRTAATLVARISDAVQMQAVLGSGHPNCVIIDEIDGAAGARLPAGFPSSMHLAEASMACPAETALGQVLAQPSLCCVPCFNVYGTAGDLSCAQAARTSCSPAMQEALKAGAPSVLC